MGFTTSTNPSASLMARIKNVKNPDFRPRDNFAPSFQGHGQSMSNPYQMAMPGNSPSGFPCTWAQMALPSTSPPGFAGTNPQSALPGNSPMDPPGAAPQSAEPSWGGGDASDMNSEAAKAIEKLKANEKLEPN